MTPNLARLIAVTVAFLTFANGASAVDTVWPPATVPRRVNITSDSAPGWTPSLQDEEEMRAAVGKFLAAKDGGQAAEAYAMLSDLDKAHQPFADFASALEVFNHRAGAVLERRVVAVNWTKNPAQARLPDIYAAVDIVSHFSEVDRDYRFLVLYQSPSGGDYRIMREEDNILDNATARKMSSAEADAAWAKLSANCPNYVATRSPLPEQQNASIGYPTVDAALQALRAKPKVSFSSQGGWTIADDLDAKTIWSFAPQGDPAYPAVAKRQLVQTNSGIALRMSILCGSTKGACDNFGSCP